MVRIIIFGLLTLSSLAHASEPHARINPEQMPAYDWLIVGGGPAGIVTVGVLLDIGVPPETILWIDKTFNVGRIGAHYQTVPSNTKTKLFVDFIASCKTFSALSTPAIEELKQHDPESFQTLRIIVQPLQDITDYLRTQVYSAPGALASLHFDDNVWHAQVDEQCTTARHVVLATGSYPKELDYACNTTIPLDEALDKDRLTQHVSAEDTIALIGSSHSAILILKYLTELTVNKIINFYKKPLIYAIDCGDWVLHNAQGLKGKTAKWAKEVLEHNPPHNLIRAYNIAENRDRYLPECNKIIYAIGYQPHPVPANVPDNPNLIHDAHTGIIGPRIFGIGIAFPEKYSDPLGNEEHRVGLNSFMDYAQRVVPQWAQKRLRDHEATKQMLCSFEELFMIESL